MNYTDMQAFLHWFSAHLLGMESVDLVRGVRVQLGEEAMLLAICKENLVINI